MDELTIVNDHELMNGAAPDLLKAFAEFLKMDVANGAASMDTIRGYKAQVGQWVKWCLENDVDPATATVNDVKAYRAHLVEAGYKSGSISFKLAVLRRFYAAAVDGGFRQDNPVIGIKAKNNEDPYDFRYLSEKDYIELLKNIRYRNNPEKELRDKVIIGMMGLQMLRTVEIERACVEDVEVKGVYITMKVRGKGHGRTIGLRQDVADLLFQYLEMRGPVQQDKEGVPLFAACGNRAGGTRISRRGIRQVVDFYLKKADLKRPGVSAHALRHTGATLAYEYTKDIRAVQDALGHKDPKTTARYAHVVDRLRNNPASAIQVQL